jgi:hypothetical protein
VVTIVAIGILLAPFFPFGMQVAEAQSTQHAPVLFGVNAIALAVSVPLSILLLVALVFVFAGILFPRLLAQASSAKEKRVIYAMNLVAGGFALVCMITLHATIGWTPAFMIVATGAILSLFLLRLGN